MTNYLLLCLAATLFGFQVFATSAYANTEDGGLRSVARFTAMSSFVSTVCCFAVNGFKFEFTVGSFALALCGAAVLILGQLCSIKALTGINMSVYSTFLAIGGMILPFVVGVTLFGETLTAGRLACCVIVTVVTLLQCKPGSIGKMTVILSLAVFVLNGMNGVLATTHQHTDFPKTSGNSYNLLLYAAVCAVSVAYLLFAPKKGSSFKPKTAVPALAYGVLNGLGNLILLKTIIKVPASVQYPIITGGIMVVSTVISAARHEKLKPFDVIGTLIAFGALFLMMI